jgi:hypothetical protein
MHIEHLHEQQYVLSSAAAGGRLKNGAMHNRAGQGLLRAITVLLVLTELL